MAFEDYKDLDVKPEKNNVQKKIQLEIFLMKHVSLVFIMDAQMELKPYVRVINELE